MVIREVTTLFNKEECFHRFFHTTSDAFFFIHGKAASGVSFHTSALEGEEGEGKDGRGGDNEEKKKREEEKKNIVQDLRSQSG